MKFKNTIMVALPLLFIFLSAVYMINPAGTHSKDIRARLMAHMPYRIPSDSMTPSLQQGDFILTNTFSYAFNPPERGDIVVFHFPEQPKIAFVKRVIGLPGDEIEMQNHNVIINGQLQQEDYLQSEREFRQARKPYKQRVPEGQLLLLGDNRDNSQDGRVRGFVPITNVVGEVTRIWMSDEDSRVGALDLDERPTTISSFKAASQ